jgi:hypothetical protein
LICNASDEEFCAVFVEEMGSLKTKKLARQALLAKSGCRGLHALMTMEGRSAAITDVEKRAPLSTAAATEAMPNVFMIAGMRMYYRNTVVDVGWVAMGGRGRGGWNSREECRVNGDFVPAKYNADREVILMLHFQDNNKRAMQAQKSVQRKLFAQWRGLKKNSHKTKTSLVSTQEML